MKFEIIVGSEEAITESGLVGSAASLIQPGAVLLVVRSGILKHTIPVAITAVAVALNQDMKAIRVNPRSCLAAYLMRVVQGSNDIFLRLWAKQGATVESIEHAYLASTFFPLPPLSEQASIAAFLDRETGKIDALVAEQERLIALLKEKRQAVISQAVTKGLNPNAPMKPSGVKWLGDVPEHWMVAPLKQAGRLLGGAGFPPELQGVEDQELHFYKVADLSLSKDGMLMDGAQHTISRPTADMLRAKIVPRRSIVYAKIGAALMLNRRRIVPTDCCIDNNMTAFVPNPVAVRTLFAWYWLSTVDFAKVVNPGAVPSLSEGDQAILPILLPPLFEQDDVLTFLTNEIRQLDGFSTEANRVVTLLKERRAALISAAVTGKIDVRNLVQSTTEPAIAA